MLLLKKGMLEICTNSQCIMDCQFCPQDKFQAAYHGDKLLSYWDFMSATSDVPKETVEIVFSGFSEPFLNPHCMDMIECSVARGYDTLLYSTLVGLKPQDVDRLKGLDLTTFCLHLPDAFQNAKIPLTQQYRDTLVRVLSEVDIDYFVNMNGRFVSNGRAGNCKEATKKRLHGWFYCWRLSKPGFTMLPNGDVVLCCMDFGLQHKLGNLIDQPFKEILASPEYARVKKNRLAYDGDILCRNSCHDALSIKGLALDKFKRLVYGES